MTTKATTPTAKSLWSRVAHLCDLRGYTYRGLSTACGNPAESVTLWKTRNRWPDIKTLACMADNLGVTMEYLVIGRESRRAELSPAVAEIVADLRELTPEQLDTIRVAVRALAERNRQGGSDA